MLEVCPDASLYGLVHTLLEESRAYQVGERRDGPRRDYACVQLVAPYDGFRLPSQEEFARVNCRNVSPRGLSFISDQPPRFEKVVVALGVAPFTFFVADVMWVQAENAGTAWHYLVGCRFVERLQTGENKTGGQSSC